MTQPPSAELVWVRVYWIDISNWIAWDRKKILLHIQVEASHVGSRWSSDISRTIVARTRHAHLTHVFARSEPQAGRTMSAKTGADEPEQIRPSRTEKEPRSGPYGWMDVSGTILPIKFISKLLKYPASITHVLFYNHIVGIMGWKSVRPFSDRYRDKSLIF